MLPTPIPCSIVDRMISISVPASCLGGLRLGLDEVHDRVGERAVVADAPGENERHAGADALEDDAFTQDTLARPRPAAIRTC